MFWHCLPYTIFFYNGLTLLVSFTRANDKANNKMNTKNCISSHDAPDTKTNDIVTSSLEGKNNMSSFATPPGNDVMEVTVIPGDTSQEEGDKEAIVTRRECSLLYNIEDRPPLHLLVLLAFQNVLTEFGSLFGYPYIISAALCIDADRVGFSEYISTVIFIAGLASLIQSFFGSRLPLLQGASYAFIVPVLVLMKTNEHLCPDFNNPENATLPFDKASDEHKNLWKANLNEINGSLMVASLFQTFVGLSGLIGVLARFIGPLTVSVNMCLIGLGVFTAASDKGSAHWGVCLLTIALVILFSQYLRNIQVPLAGGGKLQIFTLFPILMAVATSWILCLILTVTGALPDEQGQSGYLARTDIRSSAIQDTQWFRFPYPFQWGIPTVTVGGVLGMVGAMMASIIESVGDYYACAIICSVPPPPSSAVSRGIALEGFGCFLGGLFGSGGGNTSYGTNMATIGLTKVGSRAVIHGAGLIMLLLGCLGKFGGFFAMIPDPVIGGMLFVMLGMCVSVGISNLQSVDLSSSRNIFIFGFSIIFSMAVAEWVLRNPFSVGNQTIDQILNVLCGTAMFLGGMTAFILDMTVPGTRKERGFPDPSEDTSYYYSEKDKRVYDFPIKFLNTWKYFRYIPVFPGWDNKSNNCDDDNDKKTMTMKTTTTTTKPTPESKPFLDDSENNNGRLAE